MSLKLKITLVTSFVFLLIIVLLGYIFFITMDNSLQRGVELEAKQVCDEAAYTIEKNVYSDAYIIKAVMARSDIASFGSALDYKIKTIQEIVRLFEYEYILLIWDGVYYKVYADLCVNHIPEETFKLSTERQTILFGKIYRDEEPGLLIAAPALTTADGTQYQMVVKRKADWVWMDLLSSNSLKDKNVVVSTPQGQVLYPARFEKMALASPSVPGPAMSRVTLAGPDNREDVYAYSMSLQGIPLNITSYFDEEGAARKLREYVMNYVALAGCSVVLIAAIIYLMSKRMTRAITGLAKYVEKTDRPESISPVFTKRRDEAGILARAFSALMRRLQATIEEKEYIAFHDKLTELPNRYIMEQDITELLLAGKPFAYALVDIDNFKTINDQLGHMQGDLMLFRFASLLMALGGQRLKAYRWGGDEFGMALFGETKEAYIQTLDGILRETAAGLEGFEPGRVSVSIGVCICPENADTQKALLQNADNALARAKRQGKNRYCFYEDADNENASREQVLTGSDKNRRFR